MLQTVTHVEVVDWYKANIMPSPSRRKICFWVVGVEQPSDHTTTTTTTTPGTVVALDEYRASAAMWPLTKDPTHPIIAAAFA